MDSDSYVFQPDVDMSGYVSLDKRVSGVCRCEKCSSSPIIKRWYANDILCLFDHDLCYENRECYSKRRVFVGSVKGKPKYRLVVVKCKRFVVGSK